MPEKKPSVSSPQINTFGNLLRYLRKRARLTQRELAIAVGYSEAHISRLEGEERLPDLPTLAALFVPALGLEEEPDTVAWLLELAATARGNDMADHGEFTIVRSIEREVTQTMEPVPTNLPLQLTSFIGREREVKEINQLLRGEEKVRLLTLQGPGGCGKTRLAVQATEGLALEFPDGVWFVDLAPLTDPTLIPGTTAAILGLKEASTQGATKSLIAFLRGKEILILFDNCEHLLMGVAQLAESILQACPQVYILTTSRELLNIPGEKAFLVHPLPYPPEGMVERSDIIPFDSVRLFLQRARNVRADFAITDDNASRVAQICRHLDGIPLAIELAAARVGLLRIQQIEAQLTDRFRLLTSGKRTLPRHQTLRAMIDWSHQLLSEEESRLFRRLSVFAGGWTLDAAESVADPSSQASPLDLLSHLVNKSFIVVERNPGKEARYGMLETLREYAREKLQEAQETTEARRQHFAFFHKLALHSNLYGPEKQLWLDRWEAEYDNIRAAMTWALAYQGAENKHPFVEAATELVLALVDFFWFRGFLGEAREWMDKLVGIEMPSTSLRARLLQKSGWYARAAGEFNRADLLLQRAVEMAKEIGDLNRASWALGDLGLSAREQGENQQSMQYFSEGLSFARQSGEARAIGVCLYGLAEGYEIHRDLTKARELWEQGLSLFRTEGDKTHIGWGLEGLAGTAFMAKDFATARAFHLESLKIKVEVMDKLGFAYSLEGLAQVAAAEEEPERAAVLWGAAWHLRQTLHVVLEPSRERLYNSLIPEARAQIGNERFDELWKKGKTMKLEEAIQYALNHSP
jgi:predicted ATPase/DNA-binding XRE family transcriptional regulator